nr:hypothetical protein [Kibdelosporangium sp. MJ126-NF4]CTQ91309.1 hypothetical protein [Kibdelosporangium sp. MJ126-NF4]
MVALLAEDEPTEQNTRRTRSRRCDRRRLARPSRPVRLRTGQVITPDVFGDRHVVELRRIH